MARFVFLRAVCGKAWWWRLVLLANSWFVTSMVAESPRAVRLTKDGDFKQRPMWSPDGNWLVFARHHGSTIQLWLRSRDGTQVRRLTDSKNPEFDAAFAPDSQRLLYGFDSTSPGQGDVEIYAVGLDGKSPRPVATTKGSLSHEEWPSWSPDGERFALSSTRYGNQELCVAQADGTKETRLTSDPAIDAHPAWSPDGKRIAFATSRWGDLELALIDPDGKNLTRLTESPGLDDYPAWAPDGRSLAFVSNRDGNFEIYVADADGKRPQNVTAAPGVDHFPSFSPRGELTWVSQRHGRFDLFLMPIEADPAKRSTSP